MGRYTRKGLYSENLPSNNIFVKKKCRKDRDTKTVPKKYRKKNINFIKSCKNIDDVIHVIFSLFFITYLFSIIFILCSLFLFIFHLYKKYTYFYKVHNFTIPNIENNGTRTRDLWRDKPIL